MEAVDGEEEEVSGCFEKPRRLRNGKRPTRGGLLAASSDDRLLARGEAQRLLEGLLLDPVARSAALPVLDDARGEVVRVADH